VLRNFRVFLGPGALYSVIPTKWRSYRDHRLVTSLHPMYTAGPILRSARNMLRIGTGIRCTCRCMMATPTTKTTRPTTNASPTTTAIDSSTYRHLTSLVKSFILKSKACPLLRTWKYANHNV